MKLPPGYGQIIKLSGRRRRPYAVRVDAGMAEDYPGHFVRKQKYLAYFEKRTEALDYLAKYNAGIDIGRRPSVADMPTFAEVYEGFAEWYLKRHPGVSQGALEAQATAYRHAKDLHDRRFATLRTDDLQGVVSSLSDRSKSTVSKVIALFHGMYKYALVQEIADKDYSRHIYNDGKVSDHPIHTPFAPEEIRKLWEINAESVLILIYTGMRIREYLAMETANIDLDRQIMTGGSKTDAGRNRTIPIHDSLVPIIRRRMGGRYLHGGDKAVLYQSYIKAEWRPYMDLIGASHLPHDTRHTCATLLEQAGIPLHHQKLILGHAIQDVTQGIYTHVDPSALVEDINKLPVY